MTKTNLCDLCRFGEREIKEVYKPIFPTSKRVERVQHLFMYCNYSSRMIQKLMLKCDSFKPKAGKIGKNLYQKQLGET